MASGSNAPFSGEFVDLENVPTLPKGVTASEATEKLTIDNNSIVENSNQNIEVGKPSKKIVGDFENSLGDWTKTTTFDAVVDRTTTKSFRGSHSVKLEVTNSNDVEEAKIKLENLDLEKYTKLIFHLNVTKTSSADFEARLRDGSGNFIETLFSRNSTTSGFVKVEVDLSSKNQNDVRLILIADEGIGGNAFTCFVDRIILSTKPPVTVGSEAGN